MVKNSNVDRNQYFERIKPYNATIQAQLKLEESAKQVIQKGGAAAAHSRLALVDEMIFLASNYIVLSGISQSMLNVRNEGALNDARKSFSKAIIYLEELVSPYVDAPYSEYEEKLAEISTVDAQKRYNLIKRIGLVLHLLKEAYGDNTKWRWAFVELEGRYAAVAKNIMNLKMAMENTDPRSPDYEPTVNHLRLIKKLLGQTADRYRERYEFSTYNVEDFKMGIRFLNSLKRIHIILDERNDAETIKKKSDTWAVKLDMDLKQKKKQ